MPVIAKVIKNPGGYPSIIYVDTETGQPVDVTALGKVQGNTDADTVAKLSGQKPESEKTSTDDLAEKMKPTVSVGEGGPGNTSTSFSGKAPGRTAANNYGYIDKPGIVSFAGMLPGMAGMIGKGVNAGINANNMMAANAARATMGMPQQTGFMNTINGIVNDNKGYVDDVDIGGKQYAVGLEALTPTGRTTLTPMEARNRSLITQSPISKASQSKENRSGLFSGLFDSVSNFFGDLFGTSKSTSTSSGGLAGYPTAPSHEGESKGGKGMSYGDISSNVSSGVANALGEGFGANGNYGEVGDTGGLY